MRGTARVQATALAVCQIFALGTESIAADPPIEGASATLQL
jgi:hypothetical protein